MENCGRTLVLYLLYLISGVGCVQVDVLTGKNFTFESKEKGKIDSIEWRHNSNLICESDHSSQMIVWYRYNERAWINMSTGHLTLLVTKNDSGEFLGKFQVGSSIHLADYTVAVYDPVSKPIVICKVTSTTNVTLTCSVDPPVQADFRWTGPNGFSQSGNSIHITRTGPEDSVYYCTVKNKLSESTAESKLSDCNKVDPPNGKGGSDLGAVVGSVLFSGVVVVVAVAGLVYFKFKKASSDSKPGEMQELNEEGKNSEPRPQDPANVSKEDD